MEFDWEQAKTTAIHASLRAGSILREMLDRVEVREKSKNDLVTDADVAAQLAIESIIFDQFPDHGFLGEEDQSGRDGPASAWQWVVDPLDGTTNYAHGLRNFCVSIALLHHREPVLGVILDPMTHELFYAISGKGAFLEDARGGGARGGGAKSAETDPQRLRSSRCQTLDKALVAVSFPPKLDRQSIEIQHFLEILLYAQSIRRLGSAALNLCYLASGRLDAYFASKLHVWDVAAAALIAQEAGVRLARFDGSPFSPWSGQLVAAANEPLLIELLGKLATTEP